MLIARLGHARALEPDGCISHPAMVWGGEGQLKMSLIGGSITHAIIASQAVYFILPSPALPAGPVLWSWVDRPRHLD